MTSSRSLGPAPFGLARSLLLTSALLVGFSGASEAAQEVAQVRTGTQSLSFEMLAPHGGSTLTVNGPEGSSWRRVFREDEAVVFAIEDASGNALEDGSYTFELQLHPLLDDEARAELRKARDTGDMSGVVAFREAGRIPRKNSAVYGSFRVESGSILPGDLQEEDLEGELVGSDPASVAGTGSSAGSEDRVGNGLTNVSAFDQVINDDLIVTRSICVGFDCADGESFGTDTIKLKENNLRIKFDDTSTGTFPKVDWQLTANEGLSGGLDKFSIDDITYGRTPFTIRANAQNHSLYVDQGGRIGMGTSVPAVELHMVSGETPILRLEQNASSGFNPQTWDVAGNETNFFVRDATNGSQLPFRIRPGARTNSIYIGSDSHVGIGTATPVAALHVFGSDGNTSFTVDENSSSEAARVMATLENNGRVLWLLTDTSANGTTWRFRTVEGQFNFDSDLGAGNEFVLDSSGNLTILGMLTEESNREAKTNIKAIDPNEVLQKIAQLPLSTWTYKKDQEVEHLGPMAQDFYDAFGLGAGNTGITTYDAAGVALAAVQALHQRLQEQEQLNAELRARLEALEQNR